MQFVHNHCVSSLLYNFSKFVFDKISTNLKQLIYESVVPNSILKPYTANKLY